MHSTIAGLSSGVPTATVTYSDKALGVFELCGQEDHVIDPRIFDTEQVVARLWVVRVASCNSTLPERALTKRETAAQEQMAAIVSRIWSLANEVA